MRFMLLIDDINQLQTFACAEPLDASGIEMSHLKALVFHSTFSRI